jgi:hypothetical protein
MTQDIIRVEAVPANGDTAPFRYVPGTDNAPGCTSTAHRSRSVGIVFGQSAAAPTASSVPAVVVQHTLFTNPVERSFVVFNHQEATEALRSSASRGLFDLGPKKRSDGPIIKVLSPQTGSAVPAPMEVLVRFQPRAEDAPIDLASFRAKVWLGPVSKDITPQVLKFVTETGVHAPGADAPKGRYKIEINLRDAAGKESTEVVDVSIR